MLVNLLSYNVQTQRNALSPTYHRLLPEELLPK
jgi:hypothetical protein